MAETYTSIKKTRERYNKNNNNIDLEEENDFGPFPIGQYFLIIDTHIHTRDEVVDRLRRRI